MLVFSLITAWTAIAVSLVLGIRLLRLWRRTRKLPELLFANQFLIGGFLASALYQVYRSGLLPAQYRWPVRLANLAVGMVAACIGTLLPWRVFRPDRAWAKAMVGLIVFFMVGHYLGLVTAYGLPQWAEATGQTLRSGWMATECLTYHSRLRRRVRLGLGDPVVANRILLWGMSSLALVVLWTLLRLSAYIPFLAIRSVQTLSIGLPLLITTVLNTLAFFPPRAYTAWIEDRARRRRAA